MNPSPQDAPPPQLAQIVALRRRLGQRGFEPAPIDGVYAPQTRQAIRRFQKG